MKSEENRVRSEERSEQLTNTDELLARFFDILIEMDFEQQHKQQMESSNESVWG